MTYQVRGKTGVAVAQAAGSGSDKYRRMRNTGFRSMIFFKQNTCLPAARVRVFLSLAGPAGPPAEPAESDFSA